VAAMASRSTTARVQLTVSDRIAMGAYGIGCQLGSSALVASRRFEPPREGMMYRLGLAAIPGLWVAASNAIHRPSGDHTGFSSVTPGCVSGAVRGALGCR